jgi:hypothetical protein
MTLQDLRLKGWQMTLLHDVQKLHDDIEAAIRSGSLNHASGTKFARRCLDLAARLDPSLAGKKKGAIARPL